MVQKKNWTHLFQNNRLRFRMGGTEVGNWVSAYLDKNMDLLLRLTSAGGSSIKEEEEEEVSMNSSWEKEEVVEDPLHGEMEEEMVEEEVVADIEVEVKLETDPVQNLDADLDTVALQSLTKWGAPEKKKKFSLRDDPLRLVCAWWFCGQEFPEWSPFHEHVMVSHLKEVRKSFSYRVFLHKAPLLKVPSTKS